MPDVSAQVLLETINPLDMKPDELFVLADDINAVTTRDLAAVAYEEQHGAGVTWMEVLHLWLPHEEFIRDAMYTVVIERTADWLLDRFKQHGREKRPKLIVVHLPDGTAVDEIEIRSVESEPEHRNPTGRFRRPRPHPRHRQP